MYLDGLETERFYFRAISEDDILIWEEFLSDPQTIHLFPKATLSVHDQSVFSIRKQLSRYKENRLGLHAMIHKDSGEYIDQSGLLTQILDGKDEIEIGYHLMPAFRGMGFATEAAGFCKEFAFKNNITDCVISIIVIENRNSQKVAERNGMHLERKTSYFGEEVFVYRVNRPDQFEPTMR